MINSDARPGVAATPESGDCAHPSLPHVVWSRPDLVEFEEFEPECLDLRQDPEDGGPILEQPGEQRLAPLQLVNHRGESGQCCRSELALDPDEVHPR